MEYRAPDRLLRVDLSAETVESEAIPDEWLGRYVGGKGIGARYLYEEVEAGTDPLGPKNCLLFCLGPLSGLTSGEPRYAAITKSPLTNTFLDSYSGGRFPAALAGALGSHMAVSVYGRADRPVVLTVEDGSASIEPAGDLWGANTIATDDALNGEVACIGPAGETGVTYATIASDGAEHHAGRGGAGAVMGAKNLKAVVARGALPEIPPEIVDLREAYGAKYEESDVGRWRAASGVLETVDFADEVGALSTRGWQHRRFEGAEEIGIEAVREAATGRERARVGDIRGADTGGSGGPESKRAPRDPGDFRVGTDAGESVPRGATAMSLGAGLGIDDFEAVAALGETCNRLGMDLISAGAAVAWTMRAAETGVIDYDLAFGDPAGTEELLIEITTRDAPLADALAEGVDVAGERFGTEELIPTVKRMELPSYDPRGAPSMALAYATSDRGACHRRALPIEEEAFAVDAWTPTETARVVIAEQDLRSVLWCLIVDDFAGAAFDDLGAAWLNAIGLSHDFSDLRTVGERVWTLTRLFNVREGFARAEDSLPPSLAAAVSSRADTEAGDTADDGDSDDSDDLSADDPDTDAAAVGGIDVEEFAATLDAYYALRGWSDGGFPTEETIERLDLDEVVDADTPIDDQPDDYPTTARATDRSET
jgi:aldehyde:ferredoxin oxidoreductase